MTELEIMQRAKMYIDKMANGIDPLTDKPVGEDDLINKVNISRCLFYVSGVLDKVIKNGGEVTAAKGKRSKCSYSYLNAEKLKDFPYSETPIPLSKISDMINELIEGEGKKAVSYRILADLLVSEGYLEDYVSGNSTKKRPTKKGEETGICIDERIGSQGTMYNVVVYNKYAQHLVIALVEKEVRKAAGTI